jgi:transcriptional regulator with XRE-family HTH domain
MATTPLNQLAGSLLKQGRQDAGAGGKPVKQDAYARQLAAKLGVNGLARQTLSAWERGATVVPAAALLASAEVLGVDIGQLVEATREAVREKIADLEALVSTSPPDRSSNGAPLSNRIELNKGRATTKR